MTLLAQADRQTEKSKGAGQCEAFDLPEWVPEGARRYLAHKNDGQAIRALARIGNVHASTVSRQVQRYEGLRKDPLIDSALRQLADLPDQILPRNLKENAMSKQFQKGTAPSQARYASESDRLLDLLAQPGTVMAIAQGMEMGVIVRDDGAGSPERVATVELAVAQAMALANLIVCEDTAARIRRYRIGSAGQAHMRAKLDAPGEKARGFAEGQARFLGAAPAPERKPCQTESPLTLLSRRRDKDGSLFLGRDLARAGEQLREDFELAQMTAENKPDWTKIAAGEQPLLARPEAGKSALAQTRVANALQDLGPGLADIALRCCCYLEGMESIEREMGWSARSGKIVLRIALQRLRRHYDEHGNDGIMIG